MKKYDCVVIGSGHAGIEAAFSTARLGCSVLLATIDVDAIGRLSCNPSIGGISKGHLVREVDALGGLIGKIADCSSLGYRILNRSKGKAVWATRVQVDKYLYPKIARSFLEKEKNIDILQAKIKDIGIENKKIKFVETNYGEKFQTKAVIVCAGTFLNSLIHIGMNSFPGGRLYEESSPELVKSIKKAGIRVKYFKTGTCARLDSRTIDFSKMTEQVPETDVVPFSSATSKLSKKSLSCFITQTNSKTHQIIRRNLNQSPLYTGKIKATGVRYCPSLEDKIVKFSHHNQHQIFIEPEAFDSVEVYPNGLSTSLPFDVQQSFIQTIKGLEKAKIIRPGYGIEHGVIDARQLMPSLEAIGVSGLYFAGQVNGTTGYEEAAAQGLVAGINAALKIQKKPAFLLGRDQAVIGVLIDDLTSKGTNEPYRMFTSRCEFRLTLRELNSDLRLAELGNKLGLLDKERFVKFKAKDRAIILGKKKLTSLKIPVSSGKVSLGDYLKRPEITYDDIKSYIKPAIKSLSVQRELEVIFKYQGFIKREKIWLKDFKNLNKIKIPQIDYSKVSSLSNEIVEKLKSFRPKTLEQALNISGVTPAAIVTIYHYISKKQKNK
ncbi:MAG: tRNA uridine-5-carboxymethylaminomethyl(34) synthesis enzyme MnmG [Candidatus Omnitrophica bacterium]|nr:tRNA uridine-5-carboxymethylaminomethyl(34) synthesis enzyme MnmG [Candidatus Omnitrophota bacterium]